MCYKSRWELLDSRTYNQFDGISKGRVQEATERLAEADRNLFRGKGQDGGEGDDGEEIDGKDGLGAPSKLAGDDANGHHDEKKVDIVCGRINRRSAAVSNIRGGYNHKGLVKSEGNILLKRVTLVTCQL